jgi:hypothetical protein
MKSNRISRVLLGAKLEAKRKVGRPKLRWLEDLPAGLQMTEIKRWRRKVQAGPIRVEGCQKAG